MAEGPSMKGVRGRKKQIMVCLLYVLGIGPDRENWNLSSLNAEKEKDKEAEAGAEPVSTAKRSNGVFGAHMHRGVHQRGALWHGTVQEEGALQQILYVSRSAAPD